MYFYVNLMTCLFPIKKLSAIYHFSNVYKIQQINRNLCDICIKYQYSFTETLFYPTKKKKKKTRVNLCQTSNLFS